MKLQRYYFTLLLVVFVCAGVLMSPRPPSTAQAPAVTAKAREEAYRANNLGVALLEQFKHKEGAEQFRRALALDPALKLARINLAIALYNVPDLAASQREAEAAAAVAPDAPQPHYVLGLIARQQNRVEDAVAAFRRVLKIDPQDVGANVQLGQLYAQQRKYADAVALFRAALAEEPYNGTALYNLGTALLRSGAREEGRRMMQQFQRLRESGAATTVGQNYLEQGRYAEAVTSTGAEPGLVDKRTPDVVFKDVTAIALPPASSFNDWRGAWPAKYNFLEQSGGAALLLDYRGDGQLDMLEVAGGRARLYHNDRGKVSDVTARSGALAKDADGVAIAAIAGDYDDDGRADLFVLRYGASTLYHNDGGGHFTDATAAAKIPNYTGFAKSAAFVDYDHDGDLDILIAGGGDLTDLVKLYNKLRERPSYEHYIIEPKPLPAPSLLLRNNGDGTFTDVTTAAKLSGPVKAFAVVPTDYDNRRDVDLLIASERSLDLWRNMRDGTFRNVSADVGLNKDELLSTSSVAVGDVNKDGFTDFYFGRGGATGYFALSDGRGRFRLQAGPTLRTSSAPSGFTGPLNLASQFIDYDNDGLLDLVTVLAVNGSDPHTELHIWRNVGDGWVDVSDKAARGIRAEIDRKQTPPLTRSRVLA